jgi:hypothetical protein
MKVVLFFIEERRLAPLYTGYKQVSAAVRQALVWA